MVRTSGLAVAMSHAASERTDFLADMLLGSVFATHLLLEEARMADYSRIMGVRLAQRLLGEQDGESAAVLEQQSFADLLDRLHGRLGLDFTVLGERPGSLELQLSLHLSSDSTQQGKLPWQVAATVFGGLALLRYGYGKLVLVQDALSAAAWANVIVYLRRTPEAEAAVGVEYTQALLATVANGAAPSSKHDGRLANDLGVFDEINRKINSSIDRATVLYDVLGAAKRLLRVDVSWIALVDKETGEFVTQPWDGLQEDGSSVVGPVKPGECLCGQVMHTGRPMTCQNPADDPRISNPALRDLMHRENMKASLLVPLYARGELIGVLGVHTRDLRQFSDYEVSLLSTLANQAGIAIENARLYEVERANVARLEALNAEISAQRELLRRSISIHDQLTDLALAGRGLKAMARSLAGLVDNPVVVENQFFQVVTWAPAGEVMPPDEFLRGGEAHGRADDESLHGLLRDITMKRRPGRLESSADASAHSRVIAPIVVEDEVAGYVSVLELVRQVSELDYVAIEHAATIMALEMMRQKTALEVEMRLKGDLLDDLLTADYGSESAIASRAAYFGYNLNEPHRFAIVDVDDFAGIMLKERYDERRAIALKRRMFDVVDVAVRRCAPRSLAIAKSDAIIVMVNLADDQCGLDKLLAEIRERIAESVPDLSISIGVGSECRTLTDFRQSCDEARRALLILKNTGRRNETVWFERLGLYGLLFQISDRGELGRFVERALGPLRCYDRQHHAQLVLTLDAYLQSGRNLQRCAQRLHIHVNTLAYRLQRIREIGRLDFDNQEERLNAEIALRILWATSRGDVELAT